MKSRTVIALTAMLLPSIAATQETDRYHCTYGDMQRRVEIAREPGVEVPCSVHYFKDTETPGEQQVLWSADSDPTYCRSKAVELVTKLEGWGWNCDGGSDTTTAEDTVEETETAKPDEMLGDPDAGESADPEQ